MMLVLIVLLGIALGFFYFSPIVSCAFVLFWGIIMLYEFKRAVKK